MRNILLLVLLGTTSSGQAASVPLRSLLESGKGNAGSIRFDRNSFIVAKTTATGTLLTLGVFQVDSAAAGRVNRTGVFARSEYLTPSERLVFNQIVIDVALQCFNLRSERQAAIKAWLDRQNASTFRDVDTDFGPMNLRFVRDLNDDGQYYTWVYLSRTGTPGVTPWINFCTP